MSVVRKEHLPEQEEFSGDYFPDRGTDYNLYVPSSGEALLVMLFSGTASFGIAMLFYNSWTISIFFLLAAIPGKVIYCRYRAQRRRWQLREQFRDFLYSLSASVSAGHQLESALEEAGENLRLIYNEKAPIARELKIMILEIRESHIPADRVLKNFGMRSGVEEILQFSRICSLCRRTGGDMNRVIAKTAAMIMESLSIRRERRVLTAQKRLEALLLTLMPLLVLFFLRMTAFDYLSVMYGTDFGRILMSIALGSLIAAGLWSMYLTGDPK